MKFPYLLIRISTITTLIIILCTSCNPSPQNILLSPDKQVGVIVDLNSEGIPTFTLLCNSDSIIKNSRLGIVREEADFTSGLSLRGISKTVTIEDNYKLLVGKKLVCTYMGNKKVFHFTNPKGNKLDIIFQASNDGIAFRYFFPDESIDTFRIIREMTAFQFDDSTKTWIQPIAAAKSGWSMTNPSYEEHYYQDINIKDLPKNEPGWAFPSLFKMGSYWISITESALDRNYCGCRLTHDSLSAEFRIGFPQTPEINPEGALNPESTLPWASPWRIITLSKNLGTLFESTLGTDLAKPATTNDISYIKPGKSAWSWVLYKDDSTIYSVQKRFIDFAADMEYEYCLIDADWDQKIGYDKLRELSAYAKTKNIHLNVWYNSSGSWNTTPYTPRDKLLTKELRDKEFALLNDIGITGIKVDFFGGDGQSVMNYYQDILEDAASHNLMVNFHGCTIPRGWQRTYPNLVTMESIRGLEFATFEQINCDKLAKHCTVIPFTRNLFDPMDFTPVCFSEIPNFQRRTSNGFELALSVIFYSGLQHIAEVPEGMAKVPAEVKQFLRNVPVAWDITHFVDGYPGKYVVIARRKENSWYIAGINGEKLPIELSLDLSFIKNPKEGIFITDGETNRSFEIKSMIPDVTKPFKIKLNPEGGFAFSIKEID